MEQQPRRKEFFIEQRRLKKLRQREQAVLNNYLKMSKPKSPTANNYLKTPKPKSPSSILGKRTYNNIRKRAYIVGKRAYNISKPITIKAYTVVKQAGTILGKQAYTVGKQAGTILGKQAYKVGIASKKIAYEQLYKLLPQLKYYSKIFIHELFIKYWRQKSNDIQTILINIKKDLKGKNIILRDKDIIFEKGKPLYKGFKMCIKGPLLSAQQFYVSNDSTTAGMYARGWNSKICLYTTTRKIKLLNLTSENLKAILAYITFTEDEKNAARFSIGVNTTLAQQLDILQKKYPYHASTATQFYNFKNSSRKNTRISILEIDKEFSKILCEKFLSKYGYDGYWSGVKKTSFKNNPVADFHQEIVLCSASDIITERNKPILAFNTIKSDIANLLIQFQPQFQGTNYKNLSGLTYYLSGGMALRLMFPIDDTRLNRANHNLVRNTTDFDFKFVLEHKPKTRDELDLFILKLNFNMNSYLNAFIKYYKTLYNDTKHVITLEPKQLFKTTKEPYYNSICNYSVYYIMSWNININGNTIDIIDTTIIYKPSFNKNQLVTSGIFPILKPKYMLKEFTAVITKTFLSTNPLNKKRNPINGEPIEYRQKGLKNITRMKSLCKINNGNKNIKLCQLINNLSMAVKKKNKSAGSEIARQIKNGDHIA